MIKAVFIDFYGTIVHEDGAIIGEITHKIAETGIIKDESQIDAYWWDKFQNGCMNSYGTNFKTQRKLEYESLLETVKYCASSANVDVLSNMMFEQWMKPPIFDESKSFFETCELPIYIVSNIDRADILKAIEYHGLKRTEVVTSEEAKSYKPRKELFELALKKAGLGANQVVHIGDSLTSDIKGASSLGINALWINRSNRTVPDGVISISNLMETFNMVFWN